jgi:hypothetical protein
MKELANFSMLSRQHQHIFLLLLVFEIATIGWLSTDKININHGLGIDSLYGEMAQDFYGTLHQGINRFWIARALPFFGVYHLLSFFGIDHNPQTVITSFEIIRILSLVLAAYAWCLIAEELGIGTQGFWLGAIGLFLNYAILKESSYIVVKTDWLGFTIGLWILYAHLKNKLGLMLLLTAAGSFVWPSILFMGTLMILFPRSTSAEIANFNVQIPHRFHLWIAGIVTIAATIYMIKIVPGDLGSDRGAPIEAVRPLSIGLAATYLFFGLKVLLKNNKLYDWKHWFSYCKVPTFYLKLLFILGLYGLPGYLATDSGNDMTFGNTLYLLILTSILQPGVFWIAHVVYWGPMVILALFLWKPVCSLIHRYGIAITLWTIVGLIESLDSESRHLMTSFPLLIPFLVKTIEDLNWKNDRIWGLAILAILSSKVWLTIGPISGDLREFPAQMLYMSYGPWISNLMYCVQGGFVIIMSYGIYEFHCKESDKFV